MTMVDQIPVIAEKPRAACGWRKFQLDSMEDHLCSCTTHSGVKKVHDLMWHATGNLWNSSKEYFYFILF
jgi:hypothetical protein